MGQDFSLTWFSGVSRGERVLNVPVGQRYPQRGNRSAVDISSAVHDAVMAAAQTARNVNVVAANALARCHRGRNIF